MLPLLLLLVLSSASALDTDRNQPLDENVSSLNPDPEGGVKIKANVSISTIQRVLNSPVRQKHSENSQPSELDNNDKLRWVQWQGSPPNGSFSIYNSHTDRIDYICKVGCHSGFYSPSMGSYCHYPDKKEEHRSSSFEILVNEDNFEILVWKEGSSGSVPKNSVRTCSSEEMYVGKNEYGLGKVDPKSRRFYLPWKSTEYQYKCYEVLTHMKAEEDLIYEVKYNIDQANIFKAPPTTVQSSTTTNRGLNPLKETISFTKTTKDERRWDINSSNQFGCRTTINAGIPSIVDGNIEINEETTLTCSHTCTEEVSHSVSLQLTIPPNHSCTVKMVDYQYKMEIPFTARLRRTYEDGETRSVIVSGSYHGVQSEDVGIEVEKCISLSNSNSKKSVWFSKVSCDL